MKSLISCLAGALLLVAMAPEAFAGDKVGTPWFTAVLQCDNNLYATDLQICNDFLLGDDSRSCIDLSDPANPFIGDDLDTSNKSNKIPCASAVSTVILGFKFFCESHPSRFAMRLNPPQWIGFANSSQVSWSGHCSDLIRALPEEEENGPE